MNVWIVNPFDNLPSEGNRPQRYWLMAEAFAQAGHDVAFWTSDFSHATKKTREIKPADREGGRRKTDFEVVQIPTRPYPKNVCWARVRSHRRLARDFGKMALSRVRESAALSPDLIVASTPPLGLCAAAMRVARACGAKFVCDIQDAWPETFERLLPHGLKFLRHLLFAPMYAQAKRLYRQADLVTGVSARYAQLAGRDDFHLAYHGISDEGHPPPPARRCGRMPHRLVYIGNLGHGYDLETVLSAVARRPELTLHIAGLGPREESLKGLAQELGVADRVTFHGYLGADDLSRLLSASEVGVIPMRDDSWVGLPYKLGDYLKAGLRVVSSLHGECGELLKRAACGATYEYGRVDSLLAAIDALPATPVALPQALRADRIYPDYVRRVLASA